jgi:hypothetical protein
VSSDNAVVILLCFDGEFIVDLSFACKSCEMTLGGLMNDLVDVGLVRGKKDSCCWVAGGDRLASVS